VNDFEKAQATLAEACELRDGLNRKINEIEKFIADVCPHTESYSEDVRHQGSYYNRTTTVRYTYCKVCGVKTAPDKTVYVGNYD